MPADLKLYVDLDSRTLVVDARSAGRLDALRLHQGDVALNVAIYFLERTGDSANPVTIVEMPSDYEDISVAARLSTDLEDDLLFLAATFALVDEGGGVKHYDGVLDLDSEALETALNAKTSINALLDIELADASRAKVATPVRQFPVLVTRDIHRGDEDAPTAALPRPLAFDRIVTLPSATAATPVIIIADADVPATHCVDVQGIWMEETEAEAWETGGDVRVISGDGTTYSGAVTFGLILCSVMASSFRASLRAIGTSTAEAIAGGQMILRAPSRAGYGLAVRGSANKAAGGDVLVRVWGVIRPL